MKRMKLLLYTVGIVLVAVIGTLITQSDFSGATKYDALSESRVTEVTKMPKLVDKFGETAVEVGHNTFIYPSVLLSTTYLMYGREMTASDIQTVANHISDGRAHQLTQSTALKSAIGNYSDNQHLLSMAKEFIKLNNLTKLDLGFEDYLQQTVQQQYQE